MKKTIKFTVACLFMFATNASADSKLETSDTFDALAPGSQFYVTKGPSLSSSAELTSLKAIKVFPMSYETFGDDINAVIKKTCIASGKSSGAAYFDIETTSTSVKSINSASAYILTFQCY